MSGAPRITDLERRARLVNRHHLGGTAPDVVTAVRDVVAMHSTDPLTPYLGARARVDGFETRDLDEALYESRTLWRMHAMRRTLFVVPAGDGVIFAEAVGRDLAQRERRRLEKLLAPELEPEVEDVGEWLRMVEERTLDVMGDGGERRTPSIASEVPELTTELNVGSGVWSSRSRLTPRLLFLLAVEGHLVRTRPAGSWRSSQYHWAATGSWFGASAATEGIDPAAARAELARRYLAAFGPVTSNDLRWWTGWGVRRSATTLEDVEATAVCLDDGEVGFVLSDDLAPSDPVPRHVAFLPGLDPTPMGWKERGFYLGGHGERLFDRNGNVGPTVWLDGRIIGGWGQTSDGEVTYELLEEVDGDAAERVAQEAAAVTAWLDGTVAIPRFRTPLERQLAG